MGLLGDIVDISFGPLDELAGGFIDGLTGQAARDAAKNSRKFGQEQFQIAQDELMKALELSLGALAAGRADIAAGIMQFAGMGEAAIREYFERAISFLQPYMDAGIDVLPELRKSIKDVGNLVNEAGGLDLDNILNTVYAKAVLENERRGLRRQFAAAGGHDLGSGAFFKALQDREVLFSRQLLTDERNFLLEQAKTLSGGVTDPLLRIFNAGANAAGAGASAASSAGNATAALFGQLGAAQASVLGNLFSAEAAAHSGFGDDLANLALGRSTLFSNTEAAKVQAKQDAFGNLLDLGKLAIGGFSLFRG